MVSAGARSRKPPPSRFVGSPTAGAVPALVAWVLHAQCLVRMYHWSTTSYARHMATDELLERLDSLGDQMVEMHLGRADVGRPPAGTQHQLRLAVPDDKGAVQMLDEMEASLTDPSIIGEGAEEVGLISVRDELLSALGRARYLFGLS
jgi:hypothetical protein